VRKTTTKNTEKPTRKASLTQ